MTMPHRSADSSAPVARRLGLVLALGALLAFPFFQVQAQEEEATEDSAGTEESDGSGEEDFLAGKQEDYRTIEELLSEDEEVLSDPDSYTYDPGARRDPFQSLLVTREVGAQQEDRPEGPAGLLIDEVQIQGVFFLADGPVVQIQSASEDTSFLLRPGDQLWDGELVRITRDEVIFKQRLDDPTALKPFREVVKRLNP